MASVNSMDNKNPQNLKYEMIKLNELNRKVVGTRRVIEMRRRWREKRERYYNSA